VASPKDTGRNGKQRETERYRRAAELALEQLAWSIEYLRRIRRPGIARVLEQNRKTIVERYQL
jgi:hypothetical protein